MMDEVRRCHAHVALEQALAIIDDDSRDFIKQLDGRLTANTARVRRDRQRATMRMRLAERYNPVLYGKSEGRCPAQIAINIDADKLERIGRVSEANPKTAAVTDDPDTARANATMSAGYPYPVRK